MEPLQPQATVPPHTAPSSHRMVAGLPWLVFLLLTVVVLSVGSFCFQRAWQEHQRRQYYQAVFLTNDQVYYGHLRSWSGDQALLTDVYYAQAASTTQTQDTTQPQFLLVKLGEQATGPQDRLYINRDHILYVQDLKPSSQIVQLIQQSKAK